MGIERGRLKYWEKMILSSEACILYTDWEERISQNLIGQLCGEILEQCAAKILGLS